MKNLMSSLDSTIGDAYLSELEKIALLMPRPLRVPKVKLPKFPKPPKLPKLYKPPKLHKLPPLKPLQA